jgi:transcriptional regulator with XRE-family HTH domain
VRIGKGIAYFLNHRDMTAAQLAEIIGLSQSAMSMYINDKRNPSEEALLKIAQALDVPLKAIIERAELELIEERRREGIQRDPDVNYVTHKRRLDTVYRNNDLVFEFTPELIFGIRARLYDLTRDHSHHRERLPASVEAIFENVIRDVFRFHKDEIIDRLHHELQHAQTGIENIMREIDRNDY